MAEKTARRRAILYVPQRHVLNLMRAAHCPIDGRIYLRLPDWSHVPADVAVVGVHNDWPSESFGFVLEHQTFDLVESGYELPVLNKERFSLVERVVIARIEDDGREKEHNGKEEQTQAREAGRLANDGRS